jgi:hypothetical protein
LHHDHLISSFKGTAGLFRCIHQRTSISRRHLPLSPPRQPGTKALKDATAKEPPAFGCGITLTISAANGLPLDYQGGSGARSTVRQGKLPFAENLIKTLKDSLPISDLMAFQFPLYLAGGAGPYNYRSAFQLFPLIKLTSFLSSLLFIVNFNSFVYMIVRLLSLV